MDRISDHGVSEALFTLALFLALSRPSKKNTSVKRVLLLHLCLNVNTEYTCIKILNDHSFVITRLFFTNEILALLGPNKEYCERS